MTIDTPVVIVGAGPAGTIASLYLSRQKKHHVLVERATFPREKVCGEFYDGRLRKVFSEVDADLLSRMKADGVVQDIPHYAYYNSGMKVLSITCPPTANPRLSTNRAVFDSYLLNEAVKSPYTDYRADVNIADVDKSADAIRLFPKDKSLVINASLAIIATGANSSLAAKLVAGNNSSGHFLLASRGYYRNVAKEGDLNATRVYILKHPAPCYLCIVDLPGGLTTVEVCVLKKVSDKHHIAPDVLLQEIIHHHPQIKKLFTYATLEGKLKGTSLPATSQKQPVSAERVLLAGSCGGGVNPITGWGVGHAAFEGLSAAKMSLSAIKANDFSAQFLQGYDRKVHAALASDRRLGRMADAALKNGHNLTDWLLGLIAGNKFLAGKTGSAINNI